MMVEISKRLVAVILVFLVILIVQYRLTETDNKAFLKSFPLEKCLQKGEWSLVKIIHSDTSCTTSKQRTVQCISTIKLIT